MKQIKKHFILIPVLLFCIVTALFLIPKDHPDDKPTETVLLQDATSIYQQAKKSALANDLRLTVSKKILITFADEYLEESEVQVISIDRSHDKNARYTVTRELSYPAHTVSFEDTFINNDYYITLSSAKFHAPCSEENFTKNLPIALLNESLYSDIIGIDNGNSFRISFNGANSAEKWAVPEQYEFLSGSGTAIISKNHKLQSLSYVLSYKVESILFTASYDISTEYSSFEINAPDNISDFITLASPHGPEALERAVGLLLQVKKVTAEYDEEIYFEALGDHRKRKVSLSVNSLDPLAAQITTEVLLSNDSRLDQKDRTLKEETFSNNAYIKAINNGPLTEDPSVNADSMLQYLHNQLISTIVLPTYIESCATNSTAATMRFDFNGSSQVADFLGANASEQLYGDPNILHMEDTVIDTDQLICYIEIDQNTGLPLSSGINYSASYQNKEIPYHFTFTVLQTFDYSDA